MKQIIVIALLMLLSSSLTANYFLYKQANTKTLSVEPIEMEGLK